MELLKDECIDNLPWGNLKIIQNRKKFSYGIDAVLLSHFARPKKNAAVLDLCSGNAIVPLMMSAKNSGCNFCGIEIQKEISSLAQRSIELNDLKEKISFYTGDLKESEKFFSKNYFDCVTVNPPYMKGQIQKNQNENLVLARHETACTLKDVIKCADRHLKSTGDFFMIHRANRLDDIFFELSKSHLVVKSLRFVFPEKDKAATMVLLHAKKSAGRGMNVEAPLIVYEKKGIYSQEVKAIYGGRF